MAGDARNRLIDAGVSAISQFSLADFSRTVTASSLAEAAGCSRRTFYDQFETVEVFTGAVIERVMQSIDLTVPISGNPGDAVVEIAAQIRSSQILQARVSIMAANHKDDPVARISDTIFDELAHRLMPSVQSFIAEVGPFRAPWTPETFSRFLARVAVGLSVHERSPTLEEPIATALTIVTLMLTEDLGDERSASELAREITSRRRADQQERVALSQAINLRRLVIDTAVRLFAELGFQETGLEDIASAVGLSTRSLVRMMGAKEAIAGAAVEEFLPQILDSPEALKTDNVVLSVWHTLRSVRQVCLTHPGIASSLSVLVGLRDQGSLRPLVDNFEQSMVEVEASGSADLRGRCPRDIAVELLRACCQLLNPSDPDHWIYVVLSAWLTDQAAQLLANAEEPKADELPCW